jgi:hypothetical protein
MYLISLDDLAKELSVSIDTLRELIEKQILTPYGGNARLGEPRFSKTNISYIRDKITPFLSK